MAILHKGMSECKLAIFGPWWGGEDRVLIVRSARCNVAELSVPPPWSCLQLHPTFRIASESSRYTQKMAEASIESTSPKAAAASSPPAEATPPPAEETSTEPPTAENPAQPAEDFHNPNHWATLNEEVCGITFCWTRLLTLCRMRQEMTTLIQRSEMMLLAQPSQFLRAFFTIALSMGERITLSEEMPSIGMEALLRVSSRLMYTRTPNDEHHNESMDIK